VGSGDHPYHGEHVHEQMLRDDGSNKQGGGHMAKQKSGAKAGQRMRSTGAEALGVAQAQQAGSKYEWHFGRVTRLGNFEIAGGREVTIVWEEGGVTSQHGSITDEQWEIFKLAFMTTGQVAILSDQGGEGWMYDYRFLEAVR
jgi:hypothetical protein